MTRKNYILIAKALRLAAENSALNLGTVSWIAAELAATLAQDNPAFNPGRFMAAAIPEKG